MASSSLVSYPAGIATSHLLDCEHSHSGKRRSWYHHLLLNLSLQHWPTLVNPCSRWLCSNRCTGQEQRYAALNKGQVDGNIQVSLSAYGMRAGPAITSPDQEHAARVSSRLLPALDCKRWQPHASIQHIHLVPAMVFTNRTSLLYCRGEGTVVTVVMLHDNSVVVAFARLWVLLTWPVDVITMRRHVSSLMSLCPSGMVWQCAI